MIKRLRDRILAGAAGEFSSPELTLFADSYSVSGPLPPPHPTPVLPQWHVKKPGHSAKSAGGMLHTYTLCPLKSEWDDYAAVQAECEIYQKTSSHATRQGTLGHSRHSSLSHCGLNMA